jgi:hypothetical protein
MDEDLLRMGYSCLCLRLALLGDLLICDSYRISILGLRRSSSK